MIPGRDFPMIHRNRHLRRRPLGERFRVADSADASENPTESLKVYLPQL